MTEHDDLARLLRSVMPPTVERAPSRDLWPEVLLKARARPEWTWVDLSMTALIALALALSPEWLWLLALHL